MNTTAALPDFRTFRATARTGILPEAALRRLAKQGKIPGFYSGNRFLVNYTLLCELANDPTWLASISEKKV